ncbi:methyltransferase domain-containing protein [Actinoalloteichus hymeniacidonis]|uniref:Methyltransferase family protein n=1 Tax=Actinoalloteichus hymeniacidonis TaxID=340345 RepID=A0AAC9HR98_9PSEU|nr:methyltransferase domain-containing protein [Actinoalloteichus hymeniacidonis]AOS63985.1 methyltransferase family protein [Actinoalloteichus hymeniacidonis]MBB5907956.1 cyclopropane fatty-acyl-phospholipid synthase-like methyltransferase [Actinoalloteichus hymeniacidonis]
MTQNIPSADEIGDFYDLVGPALRDVWDDNCHFGYWLGDDDESSVEEATDRFTDILIGKLGIGEGHRVLDVGCGFGKPAMRIARTTGAAVVGVTISRHQVTEATRRVEESGLGDQVSFQLENAMKMPFPDASFDAVLAFESIIHMDRTTALAEMARVLKPGGRLVITDMIERAPKGTEAKSVAELAFQVEVDPLPRAEDYHELLSGTDIAIEELLDVTEHTKYTPQRLGTQFSRIREEIESRYGDQADDLMKRAVAPLSGASEIGYLVVVGRRAASTR